MTKIRVPLLCMVLLLLVALGCGKKQGDEISSDEAIKCAVKEASRQNYETNNTDIEILKVKKGLERGPIRMVTLFRQFGRDMATAIATREYWVIYFYPKGGMEKDGPKILG